MQKKSRISITLLLVNFVVTCSVLTIYSFQNDNVFRGEGYLFTFTHITDSHSGANTIFRRTTSWIASSNISFVVHTGDIVTGLRNEEAWINAMENMELIEDEKWAVLAGDNDLVSGNRIDFTNYVKFFGNSSFDQYYVIEGRLLFILFSWIELDGSISEARLDWMDEIILENQDLLVVICLHPYLWGSFLNLFAPENIVPPNMGEIWDRIEKHENIILTLSGHVHRNWVNIHVNGNNKIWTINTEALMKKGFIRLFDVYGDRIEVYGYSAWTNQTYGGPLNRFTIKLDDNSFDQDKDFIMDSMDIMPTHPLIPIGLFFSLAASFAIIAYWRIIKTSARD